MNETRPVFHSFLKPAIACYLELRGGLGYAKNRALARALEDFDYYLVFHGISAASQMDEALLAGWVHSLGSYHASGTKNRRLSVIRGLFRCLEAQGVIESNPAGNIPYLKLRKRRPNSANAL